MSRRALWILIAVTVVVVAAAIWVSVQRNEAAQSRFEAGPLFPALVEHSEAIAQIDVATRDTDVRVRRTDQGRWVVASKDDYPANSDQVRKTIFALIRAEKTDRATALPENHRKVGLLAPDKGGTATRVVLLDAAGGQLAALLIGDPLATQALTGPRSFFVRKPGDDQVWIAQGDFPIGSDPRAWLDPQILSLDRARVESATVTFPDGSGYAVARKAPDQPDFLLQTIPDERAPATVMDVPNALGGALSSLTFDDVRQAKNLPFPQQAEHVVYRTFDGLVVNVALARLDSGVWATFDASAEAAAAPAGSGARAERPPEASRAGGADPESAQSAEPPNAAAGDAGKTASGPLKSPEDVGKEVAAIDRRTAGWAYLLPESVAADLTHPLEDMLAPLEKPSKASKESSEGKSSGGKAAPGERSGKQPKGQAE